ncbi:MAG: histidine triad nucleotide-binding protein [bacterium]
MQCIFCKVANGKIASSIIYHDENALAFEDVNPQAPVHALVIPRKHISTLLQITEEDHRLLGHLFHIANIVAHRKGIAERGFRVVLNCNRDAGQTVFHIHLHVLGGRIMHWPPG